MIQSKKIKIYNKNEKIKLFEDKQNNMDYHI